jgi:hypothetical protein
MNPNVDELLQRMQALREELEVEFKKKRDEIEFVMQGKRAHFAEAVQQRQRLYRVGLFRYLRSARWLVVLTAPVIYSGFFVFAAMDLFVTLYQALCFPVYGIPKVRRRDYMIFDRGDLPYLNAIERFNCFYCAYGNGVATYLREVAARTEQYWCPIKHARPIASPHERYHQFFDYGDAASYREQLAWQRRRLRPAVAPAATRRSRVKRGTTG